jgi:hypothetical protein
MGWMTSVQFLSWAEIFLFTTLFRLARGNHNIKKMEKLLSVWIIEQVNKKGWVVDGVAM